VRLSSFDHLIRRARIGKRSGVESNGTEATDHDAEARFATRLRFFICQLRAGIGHRPPFRLHSPAHDRSVREGHAPGEVDGEAITSDEIAKLIGAPLSKLEERIYTLKRRALDALIGDKVLAKEALKRGVSVQALLEAETRNVEAVTGQEIEVAYRQQKGLKGDEATPKDQIRQQLQAMKIAARQRAFVDQLRTRSVVVINLKPPTPFRIDLKIEGAPF